VGRGVAVAVRVAVGEAVNVGGSVAVQVGVGGVVGGGKVGLRVVSVVAVGAGGVIAPLQPLARSKRRGRNRCRNAFMR